MFISCYEFLIWKVSIIWIQKLFWWLVFTSQEQSFFPAVCFWWQFWFSFFFDTSLASEPIGSPVHKLIFYFISKKMTWELNLRILAGIQIKLTSSYNFWNVSFDFWFVLTSLVLSLSCSVKTVSWGELSHKGSHANALRDRH